ncbi:cutinase family protein [Gordonia jinhuaensis]
MSLILHPAVGRADPKPQRCPRTAVLISEGTWASSGDPTRPDPEGMLYPLVQAGTAQRSVWFNPYPAQFRTPVHPDDMPFDVSVAIGEQLLRSHIAQVHAQCPAAAIVLVGYSQGATVAGDVAATSLIPIRETELLADPRRVPAMAHDVGPSPDGVGVEVGAGARVGDI